MSTRREANLQVKVSDPFFIAGTEHGVGVYCFPWLYRMPNRDLILALSLDRDQWDARRILLRSADGGVTWTEDFGPYVSGSPEYCALDENTVIGIAWTKCYETKRKDYCVFPYWISEDGGRSFGSTQTATIHTPGQKEGYDPYENLSEKLKDAHAAWFLKRATPPLPTYLEPIVKNATLKRASCLEKVLAEPNGTLLGIGSYVVAGDTKISIPIYRSYDRGQTWEFQTFAVRNPQVEYEDAFCEVAPVLFPDGELFCVLRSGSYRPLFSIRSQDGGKTWSAPEPLPVEGVMPILVLMSNGILALATGRPDNVLCLSTDRGHTWMKHIVIQEWAGVENDRGEIVRRDHPHVPADNPHLHSTGYNGLAEVEPGKLLFVYDTFSRDEHQPDRWLQRHGHGKIFGRYIAVSI